MGEVIHYKDSWKRIGTPEEKPWDRRFVYRCEIGRYRREHRDAKAAADWDAMDRLDRWYDQLQAL